MGTANVTRPVTFAVPSRFERDEGGRRQQVSGSRPRLAGWGLV